MDHVQLTIEQYFLAHIQYGITFPLTKLYQELIGLIVVDRFADNVLKETDIWLTCEGWLKKIVKETHSVGQELENVLQNKVGKIHPSTCFKKISF